MWQTNLIKLYCAICDNSEKFDMASMAQLLKCSYGKAKNILDDLLPKEFALSNLKKIAII